MSLALEQPFEEFRNSLPPDVVAAWERRVGAAANGRPGRETVRHLFRSGYVGLKENSPLFEMSAQGPGEGFAEIVFWRPLSLMVSFALLRTPCQMDRTAPRIAAHPSRHVLVATQTLPGSGRVTQGGTEIDYAGADHLMVLDNNKPFTQVSDDIADHLGIWIPSELLQGRRRPLNCPQVIESQVARAAAAFIKSFTYDVAVRGVRVDLESELAVIDLVRTTLLTTDRRSSESSHDSIVEGVADLIECHFLDPEFTTDSIARALHTSRRHLYRQLAAVGESPASMIVKRRLRRAKKLVLGLEDPDLGHIARASGFSSATVLRDRFRAEFGMAPDEFRSCRLRRSTDR